MKDLKFSSMFHFIFTNNEITKLINENSQWLLFKGIMFN